MVHTCLIRVAAVRKLGTGIKYVAIVLVRRRMVWLSGVRNLLGR